MILELTVGILGGIIGGLSVVTGNLAIYVYQINTRNKLLKGFENNIIEAINGSKPKSKPAQVYPFKAPTPPPTKLN